MKAFLCYIRLSLHVKAKDLAGLEINSKPLTSS